MLTMCCSCGKTTECKEWREGRGEMMCPTCTEKWNANEKLRRESGALTTFEE